ncbi:Alpha- and gamma-adaptin-binding protein p34 [Heracleum sosnowskyi]|uniref:Alpha- and gamma-adaptin-binding protein p34 n=1 Tax=Heracleum sosnowskyi TaxID=360622 RepID=A0AAD8IUU2_9APIA|nr:Alpha- and gamma-adaptin-binding protein p34 [Heracleum sosnowskyi]
MEEAALKTVETDRASLEIRPGIFFVGSPNVGKRTILSRLLSVDFEDASDSSRDLLAYGWTIDTKYYSADVSLWMAHLYDEFSVEALPVFDRLAALVMVFDMNDLSSLDALKKWVSRTDIQTFDILLCIGNKVDLLPDHSAHVGYRRRLQKHEESWGNTISELDYGISETEGSSLLGDEESSWLIKNSCLEWCSQHNIEYVEACASNADFDKCLSVDGDSQGVERIHGALSAHMWPGMILKSGNKIVEPSLPEKEELSEEESDYELEYEILSAGSAEPWDDTDGDWVSASHFTSVGDAQGLINQNLATENTEAERNNTSDGQLQPSTSASALQQETVKDESSITDVTDEASESDEGTPHGLDNLEQLMSGIGTMRDNLRLMPDFQRREMAANLAMKMAAMFGDGTDDEE